MTSEVKLNDVRYIETSASSFLRHYGFDFRHSLVIKNQYPGCLEFSFKIIKKPPAPAVFLCIMGRSLSSFEE